MKPKTYRVVTLMEVTSYIEAETADEAEMVCQDELMPLIDGATVISVETNLWEDPEDDDETEEEE